MSKWDQQPASWAIKADTFLESFSFQEIYSPINLLEIPFSRPYQYYKTNSKIPHIYLFYTDSVFWFLLVPLVKLTKPVWQQVALFCVGLNWADLCLGVLLLHIRPCDNTSGNSRVYIERIIFKWIKEHFPENIRLK